MSVRVRSRREWGARSSIPGGRHVAPSSRTHFVVHWPGGNNITRDMPTWLRNCEAQHRNQWGMGPGYNFAVGRGGWVWEGCGRDIRGIHSPPHNTNGFGVCLVMSINDIPPQAMLNSTRALYEWLCQVCGRRLAMQWHGANVATGCPGPRLTQWVRNGMPAQTGGGGGGGTAPGGGGGGGAPRFPGVIMGTTRNSRHGGVRTFQQQLLRRGWGGVMGAADGVFGPRTRSAVQGFQRNQRIQCTGEVGPQTWPLIWTGKGGGPNRGGCN